MSALYPWSDGYYGSLNNNSVTTLADDLDLDLPYEPSREVWPFEPVAVSSFEKVNSNDLARPLTNYSGTESAPGSPDLSAQHSKHFLPPDLLRVLKDHYPESKSCEESMNLLVEDWMALKLSLKSRSSDRVSDSERISDNESTLASTEQVEVESSPEQEPTDKLESHRRISTTTVESSVEAEHGPEDMQVKQRLACPYFQHNRAIYKHWRSCAGPGFKEIGKVKLVVVLSKSLNFLTRH